jgi:hypothetical protein
MSKMKRFAAFAAATVLATGVFVGTTTSADAAPRSHPDSVKVSTYFWDTGWG